MLDLLFASLGYLMQVAPPVDIDSQFFRTIHSPQALNRSSEQLVDFSIQPWCPADGLQILMRGTGPTDDTTGGTGTAGGTGSTAAGISGTSDSSTTGISDPGSTAPISPISGQASGSISAGPESNNTTGATYPQFQMTGNQSSSTGSRSPQIPGNQPSFKMNVLTDPAAKVSTSQDGSTSGKGISDSKMSGGQFIYSSSSVSDAVPSTSNNLLLSNSSGAKVCWRSVGFLRDVAFHAPLTADGLAGGYIIHFVNSTKIPDELVTPRCISRKPLFDCVQQALAAMHSPRQTGASSGGLSSPEPAAAGVDQGAAKPYEYESATARSGSPGSGPASGSEAGAGAGVSPDASTGPESGPSNNSSLWKMEHSSGLDTSGGGDGSAGGSGFRRRLKWFLPVMIVVSGKSL